MNERWIMIFFAVYEKESIVGVAKSLFYSSQNVSKALKEMEDYLGVKLFRRVKNGMKPTAEGERLYGKLKELQHSLGEIQTHYENLNQHTTLSILNCYVDLFGELFIRTLQTYEDEITYIYKNINIDQVYEGLLKGEGDIGIIICQDEKTSEVLANLVAHHVQGEVLKEVGIAVHIRENHPLAKQAVITPTELQGFNRVSLVEEVKEMIPYEAFLERFELNKKDGLKTNSVGSLMRILRERDSYYIGVHIEGNQRHLKGIKVMPLLGTGIRLEVVLAYRMDILQNQASNSLIEALRRGLKGGTDENK